MSTKITPETIDDIRLLRLVDLEGWAIVVTCICGRVAVLPHGALQREHRLSGITLVGDLQHLLRCQQCRRRGGFRIEVVAEKGRGRPGERSIVVVEGKRY